MNLMINAGDAMSKGDKLAAETSNAKLGENYLRELGIKDQSGESYSEDCGCIPQLNIGL